MSNQAPVFPRQPIEAPAAPPAVRAKSPLRWVAPLVLFMVIIAGIAWMSQYMPTWRTKASVTPATEPKGVEALLGFIHPYTAAGYFVAPWEPLSEKDIGKPLAKKPYAREFERNAKGSYYFPFRLVLPAQAAEIGISRKLCDCSELAVAVVSAEQFDKYCQAIRKDPGLPPPDEASLDWKSLEHTEEKGVTLAAGAYAILRVTWTNRRGPGDSLNLGAHLWARVPDVGRRQAYAFKIEAVSSHPLRAKNDRIDVGMIDPGSFAKAEFLVWSPTRDELKFSLNDRTGDALFKLETVPMSPAECADFQTRLRNDDILTRVRAAWRVTVTVHGQRGKHQLDLGHFTRAIKIDMPAAPEDMPSLYVYGGVRSEIQIGGREDQGKINLKSFPAKFGAKHNVVLSTQNQKTDLELLSAPPGLLVELTAEKAAKNKQWRLRVEVPPGAIVGPVPEDFVVILRIKGTSTSVRIPITGNGVQG